MDDSLTIRYQFNPLLTDTVGFFDFCIPLTNESLFPTADSLNKYYDHSIYNYLSPQPVPKELTKTTSVFGNHQLVPTHSGALPINKQSTDWVTILFVICLLIFAWIQTYSSKRFAQIFRAAAQTHFVNQLEREGNLFRERITLGLGFIYYTITSIFIYHLFTTFLELPPEINNLVITAIIFGTLFFYSMLKSALVYVIGVIFNTAESARSYQLNILIFNHITGILLFPFILMAFYWKSPIFLIIGSVLVSLLMLYRFYRGILTGMYNKNYNLFYLFLYLCTLEILPMLLLIKVISKTSDWSLSFF